MSTTIPWVQAITLTDRGITLRPLTLDDEAGLIAAASDGELWRLRVTSVPEPENTRQYIESLAGRSPPGLGGDRQQ